MQGSFTGYHRHQNCRNAVLVTEKILDDSICISEVHGIQDRLNSGK